LIETVPGVVDVFDGIVISGPSFVVDIDPARTWQAGFNPSDVHEQLETIIRGRTESNIQKGEKLIGIRVRYPDIYRTTCNTERLFAFEATAGLCHRKLLCVTVRHFFEVAPAPSRVLLRHFLPGDLRLFFFLFWFHIFFPISG
jgi:multidrug efflux pump subunit AcrB